jgi:ABC-type uncharacterized transport system substrate-binding protein
VLKFNSLRQFLNLEGLQMRRREFIAGLGGVVAWPFTRPLAAEAQRRVGALLISPDNQSILDAFRKGLAAFGWVEGRNLRIDYRFAGDPSRLAADAEELVNLRPDVIFAFSGPAALAVSAAHISHPDCVRGRPQVGAAAPPMGYRWSGAIALALSVAVCEEPKD